MGEVRIVGGKQDAKGKQTKTFNFFFSLIVVLKKRRGGGVSNENVIE